MPREREGVHHQREAEQVGRLAQVTLAVCAVQVERVLERAVDALRVTTPRVQAGEIWIGARDRAQVLGAV